MKKVLVVDDSPSIRLQLTEALDAAGGFEILEAEDGLVALEIIEKTKDISLVFCDFQMPKMNGMEFLEKVKNSENMNNLPIIMLTSVAESEFIYKAKKLGATGWLTKPFKAEKILSIAKKIA